MGSCMDTGYYQDESARIKKTKCKKAKNGKHKWIKYGSWPSTWWKCKYCETCRYSK